MSPRLPTTSPDGLWICIDCAYSITGTDLDASAHFNDAANFTHWIFEFSAPVREWDVPEPTGLEIHTADWGGYYLSTTLLYPREEVYLRLAVGRIKRAFASQRANA